MAPFKLKFRMGSSRSTSQENDADPQVNEALLGTHNQEQQQQQNSRHQHNQKETDFELGASSSTIDMADCNSLGSIGNNASERKLLLPDKPTQHGNNLNLGYISQSRTPSNNASPVDPGTLPSTPPPSYEHVLEEKTRLSQNKRKMSPGSATPNQNSRRSSAHSLRHSVNSNTALEQLALNPTVNTMVATICNNPDCQQNYSCSSVNHYNNNNDDDQDMIDGISKLNLGSDSDYEIDTNIGNDDTKLSVNEFLLETEMAELSRDMDSQYGTYEDDQCTDEQCAQCSEEGACGGGVGCEPVYDSMADADSYDNFNEGNTPRGTLSRNGQACTDACCVSAQPQMLRDRCQQQQQQQQQQSSTLLTPELMSNKSSKEIYKDLAKQWGITCKMSESCRCMDCQSHYFDCDFDDNEHQKTDGGLGAGTPMFISEVMHGSACTIL